jgi:hypothetical protein
MVMRIGWDRARPGLCYEALPNIPQPSRSPTTEKSPLWKLPRCNLLLTYRIAKTCSTNHSLGSAALYPSYSPSYRFNSDWQRWEITLHIENAAQGFMVFAYWSARKIQHVLFIDIIYAKHTYVYVATTRKAKNTYKNQIDFQKLRKWESVCFAW